MQWLVHVSARNPLACSAIAAIAGILLSDQGSTHRALWFVSALVVGAWTIWRPSVLKLGLLVVLAFGLVHQCCLEAARDHPLRTMLKPGQNVAVQVVGKFVRAPMLSEVDPERRLAVVEVSEVFLVSRGLRVSGRTKIRVWLPNQPFVPQGGAYKLEGTFHLIERARNPSIFDPEISALRQGIVGELSLASWIMIGKPEFSLRLSMLEAAERCRRWIAAKLALGIEDQEMPRVLTTTMALGTFDSGNAELEEPFRNSGTLHIFAVSGLHVGLLAVIGWMFLRLTGIGRVRAIFVLLPLIFGYAFMTGWVPSAARAAYMSAIMLSAPLLNRTSRPMNSLGCAALILLCSDTLQLFQPGFQLSFGVLAAISLGQRPIAEPFVPMTELDPFLPPVLATWRQNTSVWLRRHLLGLLSTSAAAWLGSLPFLVMHFHTCTPVAVIANVVLVPLSFVSLFTVSLTLLAALLHLQSAVIILNNTNWLLAHAMMSSATLFSSIPGGHFPLNPPSFAPAPEVELSVLSLPQGQAAQLLKSDGRHWMLDCGNTQQFRQNVQSFLRHEGIARLDGMVLSHADADHMGAAPLLIEGHSEIPVFIGIHEPWRFDSRATAMWKLAKSNGNQLQKLRAGDRLSVGKANLHVLFPSLEDLRDKGDDRAMVIRIDCGKMRILWCSDAGFGTEKALLQRFGADELQSHALIRNQHRSDLSALEEFIVAVNPSVIVSSNAPRVDEERLPEHLRQTCIRRNIRLMDLNETGMVQIDMNGEDITLRPWLAGEPASIGPEPRPRATHAQASRPLGSGFQGE